jgi:hypothetical protein
MANCVICGLALEREPDLGIFDCRRCGRWQVLAAKRPETWTLNEQLTHGGNEVLRRSNLSHKVRRMERDGAHVGVPLDDLRRWGLDDPLPKPMEQAKDLITYVGDRLPTAAHRVTIDDMLMCAWIGAVVDEREPAVGLQWLSRQDQFKRYVLAQPSGRKHQYWLTWDGWAMYEELKREDRASRVAFMAMKFGDDELNAVVADCFKPAVAATGFTLNLLTDGQGAGCIDDQLRVAIRRSAFLLADLSHGNQGAYWEAGFAEGLGKPVIYTCKQSVWDKERTHFDTNHLVTVMWSPDDLDGAARRLKATIRATLPEVAKLDD